MEPSSKAIELAHMLLHIGGLSGSAALISIGHLLEALFCAFVASACVLILTGATALAQIIKFKASDLVSRASNSPTQ